MKSICQFWVSTNVILIFFLVAQNVGNLGIVNTFKCGIFLEIKYLANDQNSKWQILALGKIAKKAIFELRLLKSPFLISRKIGKIKMCKKQQLRHFKSL